MALPFALTTLLLLAGEPAADTLRKLDVAPEAVGTLGDGSSVAVGGFTRIGGDVEISDGLVRLNPDGTLDARFRAHCDFNSTGDIVAIGKERIATQFACERPGSMGLPSEFKHPLTPEELPRLLDGEGREVGTFPACDLGPTFVAGPDGGLIVGDDKPCDTTKGSALYRVDASGKTLTPLKHPFQKALFRSMVTDSQGRLLIHGLLTMKDGKSANLVRLLPDGTLDSAFTAELPFAPCCRTGMLAVDEKDRVYLAVFGEGLFRFNPDGRLDAAFGKKVPKAKNLAIYAMAPVPGGGVVVGGNFPRQKATRAASLMRLKEDGSLDGAFADKVAGALGGEESVKVLLLQPDGRLLVGGEFEGFKESRAFNLVRLLKDGSVDGPFAANLLAGFDASVHGLALQPGGKLLVGGSFNTAQAAQVKLIARVRKNGSFDAKWSTAAREAFLQNAGEEGVYKFLSVKPSEAGGVVIDYMDADCAPGAGTCVCERFSRMELDAKGGFVDLTDGEPNPGYECDP